MTGRVIRMPLRPGVEPWLSKKQLAAHLGFTTRWVELRVAEGMPCERWGGRLRFRISEVDTEAYIFAYRRFSADVHAGPKSFEQLRVEERADGSIRLSDRIPADHFEGARLLALTTFASTVRLVS